MYVRRKRTAHSLVSSKSTNDPAEPSREDAAQPLEALHRRLLELSPRRLDGASGRRGEAEPPAVARAERGERGELRLEPGIAPQHEGQVASSASFEAG